MLGRLKNNIINAMRIKIDLVLLECQHSVPMGITGKTMGSMFAPVPVEIACYEPETVGCKF